MVVLTAIAPNQSKFDALVDQINGLYAKWRATSRRSDDLRAEIGHTLVQLRGELDGRRWQSTIKKYFGFSVSWANELVAEVEGRKTPEQTREAARQRMRQNRAGNKRPEQAARVKVPRTVKYLEARLKEEKERRIRGDERNNRLSHDFAVSQRVVAGLTSQIEALRGTTLVDRFRGIWKAANEAERAEIRKVMD